MEHEVQQIKIYGVTIDKVHDHDLGPIAEMSEDFPFFGIVYCGFKNEFAEVRQPTPRLWYFQKTAVLDTGVVEDFAYENGAAVTYFVLPLTCAVFEKFYRPVELSIEASATSQIFAQRFASQPKQRGPLPDLSGMEQGDLENAVSAMIVGDGGGGDAVFDEGGLFGWASGTLRQTYKETRYDPWSKGDKRGGDHDY